MDAERRFYEQSYRELERFFRGKVPVSEVYDAIQLTLQTFVEKGGTAATNPRAYLYAIARFVVLRVRDRIRPNEAFDSARHALSYSEHSPSVKIDRRRKAFEALEQLPFDHRLAFELRHCVGLDLHQTAEAVGVSHATVRRYLDAADAALAARFAQTEYARALSEAYWSD